MKVSDTVQKKVDELVAALRSAHGEGLVAVLAHGSAVRGGWQPGSDVDLVIVLREASRATLERSANAVQGARWAARIEAMILVEDEIPRAADVFPVFYAELQQHHELLHGRDPFEGLRIERHHLRLRVEQELREAQIRLRRAVVDALGSKEALAGVTARKLKQVRSPLRALLSLSSVDVASDLASVLAASCKALDVQAAPLERIDAEPGAAHAALVTLLDRAIARVDAMEEPS